MNNIYSHVKDPTLRSRDLSLSPKDIVRLEKPRRITVSSSVMKGRETARLASPSVLPSRELFTFNISRALVPADTEEEKRAYEIPEEGDTVLVGDTEVRLGKALSQGAEGMIYTLSDDSTKLVKILYKASQRTLSKIGALISLSDAIEKEPKENNAPAERLALPVSFVTDKDGNRCGCLMKRLSGAPLASFNYRNIEALVPTMKTTDLLHIARSLTELTAYCHDELHLCLGDILTPYNTLTDGRECYLCDLDSVQVSDGKVIFPTGVGRQDYLAPERLSADPNEQEYGFIRTRADDEFALAVMLFELIVPGAGKPYAQKDGDYIENTIAGNYIYFVSNKEEPSELIVNPIAVESLSRIPAFIKKAFSDSFRYDGKHFAPEKRLKASEWTELLKRYENALEKLPKQCSEIVSPDLFGRKKKAKQRRK